MMQLSNTNRYSTLILIYMHQKERLQKRYNKNQVTTNYFSAHFTIHCQRHQMDRENCASRFLLFPRFLSVIIDPTASFIGLAVVISNLTTVIAY